VLSFRTEGSDLDTALFRRTALVQRGTIGWAPVASPTGYVRIGLQGQVRREAYVPEVDTALAIPDTVTGAVGVFAEWLHPAFQVVTHYNGFAREEDLDLSTKVHLAVWAVPSAFGYEQTGVVPAIELQSGAALGKFFGRLQVKAHGQFSSGGLDSGQVWGGVTLGSRVIPRQATVLHVEAGAQENPVPGGEFDLGHGLGPRAFAPHAFTGTRSIWAILEHRVFLIDDLLQLMGVGLAAFVDYGGAWFADQSARFGGNVGLGLRLGTTRSSGPNVGRLDLAYQFGEGVGEDRWVFSVGRSYEC
jgi:hypothetical protein